MSEKLTVWVCSNCGTPVEPMFFHAEIGDGGGTGFRCPGDAEGCSPHKSRELLTPEQLKGLWVEDRFWNPSIPLLPYGAET